MNSFNQTELIALIATIKQAESLSYNALKPLSRDLLLYVEESGDIGMVNRLLEAMRPVLRKAAVEYFSHFLPYSYNTTVGIFDGKVKNKKRIEAKLADMVAFLSNPTASLYSWKKEKGEAEKKPVNYSDRIAKDVTKAIKEDLQADSILAAVVAGGISMTDLAVFLAKQPAEAQVGEAQVSEAA